MVFFTNTGFALETSNASAWEAWEWQAGETAPWPGSGTRAVIKDAAHGARLILHSVESTHPALSICLAPFSTKSDFFYMGILVI